MSLLTKMHDFVRFNKDSKKASKEFGPNGKKYRILGCPDFTTSDAFFNKFRNYDTIRFLVGGAREIGPYVEGKIDDLHIISGLKSDSECYTFLGYFSLKEDSDVKKQVFGKINLTTRRGLLVVNVDDVTK